MHGFLRAVWAEERDIAEDETVRAVLAAAGFDPALADRGLLTAVESVERNTDEALRRGVFGTPSYVVGDEVFWGQDRLPLLEAHLAGVGVASGGSGFSLRLRTGRVEAAMWSLGDPCCQEADQSDRQELVTSPAATAAQASPRDPRRR